MTGMSEKLIYFADLMLNICQFVDYLAENLNISWNLGFSSYMI